MATRIILLLIIVFIFTDSRAQTCTNLGQNPSTAFPVCGSAVFSQSNVAICGIKDIPTPCAGANSIFQDKNPYWYKFTCFADGTLGFLITPNNLNDDYDWQLFDVTGHNPDDVYTDNSLFVACNWSGEPGKTGSSSAGNSLKNCEGTGVPLFSKMPDLFKGHNYLLLVSHFTNSQSGYKLEFAGGTASITDTTLPRLKQAEATCNGLRLGIKLNKKMKCASLTANGSEFSISGAPATVTSASTASCATGFDMDSIILTLSNPLAPGSYNVSIKKGADQNTLLDNCDAAIPDSDQVSFTVYPSKPAAIDSITRVDCAPDEVHVVFNQQITCNSVAADGSDFTISGASTPTITGAVTTCVNNLTRVVTLKLSRPIQVKGLNTVTLKNGFDGNTVLSECLLETLPGATASFSTQDTVSANFNYSITYGCKADSAIFSHPGGNDISIWKWNFNNYNSSTLQNPHYIFPTFGEQQVKLFVSNGTCADSSIANFVLDNELKARITGTDFLCPQDKASFRDTSIGSIINWQWDFGNGYTSAVKNPSAQVYPTVTADKLYPVRLIVENNRNCFDTAYKQVKVLYNCYIAVATAFTPNGDGKNDYLYPINAWKAKNLVFKVYNRFGQLLFQTKDWTNKWDGTFNGILQQTGTYVWTLSYTNSDSQQSYNQRGTAMLIR